MNRLIVLGITGKTASGKSTIGRYIEKKIEDTLYIDVDRVAKDIYCTDETVRQNLTECFGEDVCSFEGTVNYKLLGEKVFSSVKDLGRLNDLMFPLIEQEVQKIIRAASDKKCIIIDAAILFDSNLYKICDYIIWVQADMEKRNRLIKLKNRHFSEKDIKLRLEGQHIKIIEKLVTYRICNKGTLKDLYEQANMVISEIKSK